MPFLPPNQQRQSTEGTNQHTKKQVSNTPWWFDQCSTGITVTQLQSNFTLTLLLAAVSVESSPSALSMTLAAFAAECRHQQPSDWHLLHAWSSAANCTRSVKNGQITDIPADECYVGNVMSWRRRTHTHPFNGPLSRTTEVSRYQKGKTNLDFSEARDSEWQWHQLSRVQVCTSLQTDNDASTPPLSVLQAGCPSCRTTNSTKALKAIDGHCRCKMKTRLIPRRELSIGSLGGWYGHNKQSV